MRGLDFSASQISRTQVLVSSELIILCWINKGGVVTVPWEHLLSLTLLLGFDTMQWWDIQSSWFVKTCAQRVSSSFQFFYHAKGKTIQRRDNKAGCGPGVNCRCDFIIYSVTQSLPELINISVSHTNFPLPAHIHRRPWLTQFKSMFGFWFRHQNLLKLPLCCEPTCRPWWHHMESALLKTVSASNIIMCHFCPFAENAVFFFCLLLFWSRRFFYASLFFFIFLLLQVFTCATHLLTWRKF